MRFDIITIFPEFFVGPLDYGIVRRAREAHLIETGIHDLRNFTLDRHRTVDDRPFGGGEGMVLKPEPIFKAVEAVLGGGHSSLPANTALADTPPFNIEPANAAIVLLSASGKLFRQETARRFAKLDRIVLLCGRYEGVDERVAEHLATDEISIGDFVLSGGELPAALIIDSVARLIPGALGNEDSAVNESFSEFHRGEKTGFRDLAMSPGHEITGPAGPALSGGATLAHSGGKSELLDYEPRIGNRGILDFPHYTRPPSFRGWDVPGVLLGGHHEEIRRWRRQKAIEKTMRNRPDLLDMVKQGKSDR